MADPTSKQRLTKAERKEQARLQRIELQRKMARSRRRRRIVIATVAVALAGLSVYVVTRPETPRATPGELFAAAPQAKEAAGCSPVQDTGPYQPRSLDGEHVPTEATPALSTYPTVPPASGPHNDITLGAGVYTRPPAIERLLHSLEHGAAVVWYHPDVSGPELERLRAFYAGERVGGRVIVAPYDYPDEGAAGSLPAGTQMALVAWHRMQTCERLSLPAAFAFTATHAAPPFGQRPYLGEAPEAGAGF